jgi:hypothetical protein
MLNAQDNTHIIPLMKHGKYPKALESYTFTNKITVDFRATVINY